MTESKCIEIDYCPDCRGVWLDRGELDKLIEKAQAEQAITAPAAAGVSPQSQPPAQPQGYYVPQPQPPAHPHSQKYGGHHPYKRKKSWLEDIFD